jgi:molecular chaperone DnaJ
MELRVAGNGHAGIAGGSSGDLFVRLEVEEATRFDRRGQDLYAVLDITVTQAALGGEVAIAGIDGDERVRIDAGTESGTIVRLKGKGVPNLNRRGRGDLYVTLHVLTPKGLSREERQLLARLAELRSEPRDGAAAAELRRPEF